MNELLIIDGKKTASEIRTELKIKTEALIRDRNIHPCLAVLLVGDNPASVSYVNYKKKDSLEVGYKSILLEKPPDTSEQEVLDIVHSWNNDASIHGILVQLPLPNHIDEMKVINAISPDKDVDGFHPVNFGKLVIGLPGFVSCTPAGILELMRRYSIETKGKHTVVLGRSNIVGKPIANLMLQKRNDSNSTVTVCHTGTKNLSNYTRQADILICAMGVPEMIKADDVKDGVVVIDVGTNRVEDSTKSSGFRLTGDVDFAEVSKKASAITPVPGGVGPMTRAMLMVNTYLAATGELLK